MQGDKDRNIQPAVRELPSRLRTLSSGGELVDLRTPSLDPVAYQQPCRSPSLHSISTLSSLPSILYELEKAK